MAKSPFEILKSVTARKPLAQKFMGDPYIAEAAVLVPSDFRNNPGNPQWFFGPNGFDYQFRYDDVSSAATAYRRCPPVAAVVNRLAQAYINGATGIINTKGKDVTKTDPTAKKIMALLAQPNPLQSWKEFEAQNDIFVRLFGFCFVLPIYSAGFEVLGLSAATSIWNIPSYLISGKEISATAWYKAKKLSDIIPTIRLKYKNLNVEIPTDDLVMIKDFTPSMDTVVIPGSRIQALELPINNCISAYESRRELINYAGAQGILSPDGSDVAGSIPLTSEQKSQMQSDFKRQYGLKPGQFRFIISPSAMKWSPMGKATKDLMLFEEVADDIMRICDGFNYPSPLLNSDKGPSVSNTEEYKKIIYTDEVIPSANNRYEQWNKAFKLEQTNITLVKTYDHLPILQADQVSSGQAELYEAQALLIDWQNNVITLNQYRVGRGYDPTPDGDIYYYQTQGKKTIEEANSIPPALAAANGAADSEDPTQDNPDPNPPKN